MTMSVEERLAPWFFGERDKLALQHAEIGEDGKPVTRQVGRGRFYVFKSDGDKVEFTKKMESLNKELAQRKHDLAKKETEMNEDDKGVDKEEVAKISEAEVQVRVEAEAQRLAKIMMAEARRVAVHEEALKRVNALTEASYAVESAIVKRLTGVMYLLLRDKLPVGDVNEIVKASLTGEEVRYSDELIRMKAESIAEMIARGAYVVTEIEGKCWVAGSSDDPSCQNED